MAKVVPVKIYQIIKKGVFKRGEFQPLITGFVVSKNNCCEVIYKIGRDYKTIHSAEESIRRVVERSGENLKVHRHGRRIFLVK